MIYLLDTDTVIFMLRGLKAPARQRSRREKGMAIVQRCQQEQQGGNVVGLSAITVSELEFGAHNGGRYEEEIAAVHKILMPFDLFDYSASVCSAHYGRIRYDLERSGQTIGSMDLLIAAHALALQATLVSNNLPNFQRVPGLTTMRWS